MKMCLFLRLVICSALFLFLGTALHSLPSPLQMSCTTLDSSLPQVTCYLYQTRPKKGTSDKCGGIDEGGTFPARNKVRRITPQYFQEASSSFLAVLVLIWANKGCVPHGIFSQVWSSTRRWESCCGSCPAQLLGFHSLGMGWDGKEQGERELGVTSPDKFRAWPGWEPRETSVTSSCLAWRQPGWHLVMAVGKPGYPARLPGFVLHLSCFCQ